MIMKPSGFPLTADRLKELLSYDPESGAFTRAVRTSRTVRCGDVAGCDNGRGYVFISVDGRRYYAHRLAWMYVYGEWPSLKIDHINGIRSDNRIINLRDVSSRVNSQNSLKPFSHGTTGVLGAHSRRGRFYSRIKDAEGKTHYLGAFGTPEEAGNAYRQAKRRLHHGWVYLGDWHESQEPSR